MKYNILSLEKAKELFNSSKSDKLKASSLFKSLILLDNLRKFPTAKEITLEFLNSNVKKEIKVEVANYILKENYISPLLSEEFPPIKIIDHSPFIREVISSLDRELGTDEYFGVNFNFVRREAVFWLINTSENPKEAINALFKEKLDWFDFPTQNGILDYCFQKKEELGMDFAMNIFNRAVKVNMREVRITALKYAYLLSKDEKYLSMIGKDSSKYINKLIEKLKDKEPKKEKSLK